VDESFAALGGLGHAVNVGAGVGRGQLVN
jgi:hypothetical protein